MHQAGSPIYEFQGFRLDAGKRVLLEGGKAIPLTPKVFDTLLYMLEHAGETFSKEALMQAVWPDTIVEENNLNQNISTLRRVLGVEQGRTAISPRFRAEATSSPRRWSASGVHPQGLSPRSGARRAWRLRCSLSTT